MDQSSVISRILDSYDRVAGLSNANGVNLPSKREVGAICEDLLQILFPGFHDVEPVSAGSLPLLTRHRLVRVQERLEEQVCRSLRVEDPGCPDEKAASVTAGFFDGLADLREVLSTDVVAAYEGDPAARDLAEVVLSYPSIEAIAIQRMAHWLYGKEVPMIPRIMTEWAHSRTGIDIHPGAAIGSYFFIDHGTGVVIGETCRIGVRVKLYHGVTLGARSFVKGQDGKIVKGGKRHPDVGDGVTIYPNSTILGGETVIGEGTTIGANVYLMHSVPPNSLVTLQEKEVRVLDKNARGGEAGLEWHI